VPSPAFFTGGVAAADFDGDGLTDLVFTRLNDTDILYRNLGDGTFEPRTKAAGFATPTLTNGVAAGDIDNDGDQDLYMTTCAGTRNHLYLNDGAGVFTDAGTARPAALANGVIIELNASPWRLDMDWRWWRKAAERGLMTAINPDAHATGQLDYFRAGVHSARKGWLREENILNCRPLEGVRAYLGLSA